MPGRVCLCVCVSVRAAACKALGSLFSVGPFLGYDLTVSLPRYVLLSLASMGSRVL